LPVRALPGAYQVTERFHRQLSLLKNRLMNQRLTILLPLSRSTLLFLTGPRGRGVPGEPAVLQSIKVGSHLFQIRLWRLGFLSIFLQQVFTTGGPPIRTMQIELTPQQCGSPRKICRIGWAYPREVCLRRRTKEPRVRIPPHPPCVQNQRPMTNIEPKNAKVITQVIRQHLKSLRIGSASRL